MWCFFIFGLSFAFGIFGSLGYVTGVTKRYGTCRRGGGDFDLPNTLAFWQFSIKFFSGLDLLVMYIGNWERICNVGIGGIYQLMVLVDCNIVAAY